MDVVKCAHQVSYANVSDKQWTCVHAAAAAVPHLACKYACKAAACLSNGPVAAQCARVSAGHCVDALEAAIKVHLQG